MSSAKFKVISDSCCDLTKEEAERYDVGIVPLYVAFQDGVYQRMMDHPGDYPKTSLPSVEDYIRVWEPYVKEGMPVLSISMTSKMSGSFNSARMAKDEILETYPEAQIEVIDSLALTVLDGMIVRMAAGLRDQGMSLSEAAHIINEKKTDGRAYFTIGDLSYLAKGGRIGGLIKLAAVGLGLKPVILFQNGGISLSSITRSRQKSLRELARQSALFFTANHENPEDFELEVGYGLKKEDGEELKKLFLEALGEAGRKLEPRLVQIGTMVGAHNGPLLMGIVMFRKLKA